MNIKTIIVGVVIVVIGLGGLYWYQKKTDPVNAPAAVEQQQSPINNYRDFTLPSGR